MKKLLILATIAVASLLWTSNALADDDKKDDAAVAKVPEPASLTLLAVGLAALPLLRRRRS